MGKQTTQLSFEVITSFSIHLSQFVGQLTGQQVTDEQGVANFDTIYPGWYYGRATHIHVKVHVGATLTNVNGAIFAKGGHVSYTGQLYFNDTLTDEVAKLSPYTSRQIRRLRNTEDFLFIRSQGSTTIMPVEFLTADGLRGPVKGDMTLAIDPEAVSMSSGGRPRPGERPRPGSRPRPGTRPRPRPPQP